MRLQKFSMQARYHAENFCPRGRTLKGDIPSMNYVLIYGSATAAFLLLAFLLIRREPRRLINGFLLEMSLLYGALTFIYAVIHTKVGSTVAMGFVYLVLFSLCGAGLTLLADGVIVLKHEGFSKTHIQPVFWGLLTLLGAGIWYQDCFGYVSGSEIAVLCTTFMMKLVMYVPLALGGFFLYTPVYKRLKKPLDCPYIVVLGCAIRKDGTVTPLLKSRLDAAIRWYRRGGCHAKLIVSGGQGKNEVVSEAEAMKRYLLSCGIPDEQILKEERSTTTRENLKFSKELMQADGGEARFLIATSDYHVLRASFLAREMKMDAQGVGGRTALYYVPAAAFREYLALIFSHKTVILLYLGYVALTTLLNIYWGL